LEWLSPQSFTETLEMIDANNLSKYNDLWLGAMLSLRHGHHRRQRPSKELPLCSVLVEIQLTLNQNKNPLRFFLGVFLLGMVSTIPNKFIQNIFLI
jgi:hypothetical protein